MTDEKSQISNNLTSDYYEEYTISFTDITLTLARQIKVILVIPTILCTLMITYVLYIAKPVYVSSAKFISSSRNGNTSQAIGLAAQFGIDLPISQTETKWVYKDIIKSRTLTRAMLKRKYDTNEFGLQKSLLQILTYGNKKPKYGIDTLEILGVDYFLEMIEVNEDIKNGIYTLKVSSSEPKLSMELTQSLIQELDRHQREYNKGITSETRQFIQERIVEINKELEIAEEALRDFTTRNRRIENSPLLLLEQQRLTREVSVLIGVFTTLKQQLETTKIEEVKESEYVVVLDPPEIPLFYAKPKKKQMVILTGLLGLGIGIILAIIRENLKNRDKDEKDKIDLAKSIFLKNLYELFPRLSK